MPSMITAICILYARDDEIFGIVSDNGIELTENKKIITKIDKKSWNNSNYGINEISSMDDWFYKWNFRVNSVTNPRQLMFGISSKQAPNCYTGLMYNECIGCVYCKFRSKEKNCSSINYLAWIKYCDEIKEGDIISLCLDLKRATIKLIINGKDYVIAFQNIQRSMDINYRFFVTLYHMNDCVEILNFTRE